MSLPLTPFEKYLLWEDHPDQPCWIIVKNCFRGTFDRERLQIALDRTIARHPLLRSKVLRTWTSALHWIELPGWRCTLTWEAYSPGKEWPTWKPIDLWTEPGARFLVRQHGTHTDIIFHFHHAVCDGKALREILYDLFGFYAAEMDTRIERPVLDDGLLPFRNRLSDSWFQTLRSTPHLLVGLWLTWRYQRKQISPILPLPATRPVPETTRDYPALVSRRLDWDTYGTLRDEARLRRVSVNDLLVRDLFATVGLWRRENAIDDPLDWVRIVLPVDVRRPSDRLLPAANVTSIVTLDRRAKSLFNRDRLLQRVHEEMTWVKHRWLRYTFLAYLDLLSWLPGGIRRRARKTHCQGTIIFANHCHLFTRSPLNKRDGPVTVPGAVLEDIRMVSPLLPGTAAALVVGTYHERFYCELHYDPAVLTQDHAERFISIFADQLTLYSRC